MNHSTPSVVFGVFLACPPPGGCFSVFESLESISPSVNLKIIDVNSFE